jgi:hypothetical protein
MLLHGAQEFVSEERGIVAGEPIPCIGRDLFDR